MTCEERGAKREGRREVKSSHHAAVWVLYCCRIGCCVGVLNYAHSQRHVASSVARLFFLLPPLPSPPRLRRSPRPLRVLFVLFVLFVLHGLFVLRVLFVPLVLLGYNWNTECLHGLGAICLTVGNETRCPSVFAAPPLLGATFNRTVAHQLGEVGRREVERELGERDGGEGETEA